MKLLTALLSLTALVLALVGPAAASNSQGQPTNPEVLDWRGKCGAIHPSIVDAVKNFCSKAGYSNHVPRQWTVTGSHSDNSKFVHYHDPRGAWVSIGGNCNPAQWVPMKYCFLQFYQMCVQFGGDGSGLRKYGKDGCQAWGIQRYDPNEDKYLMSVNA